MKRTSIDVMGFLLRLRGEYEQYARDYKGSHALVFIELHTVAIGAIIEGLDTTQKITFSESIAGADVTGVDIALNGIPIRTNDTISPGQYRVSLAKVINKVDDEWLQSIVEEVE